MVIFILQGYRHRLRAVSNSIQNCPIIISVDNHTLIPITTDGMPIQPVEVDSLTIYGGERWDFVVNASEEIGTYWIKFQGLLDCDDRFKSAYQVAVMRYEGVTGYPSDLDEMTYDSSSREGMNLNTLNQAPGDGTFLTAADIRSIHQDGDISRTPDYKFWMDFDFKDKDNELFHNKELYPFYSIKKNRQVYIPQINEISMRLPNAPPLSQPEDVDYSTFCNGTDKKNCTNGFCYCPHVLNVEKDSLVELILVDEGYVYWANHPFHIHGHTFSVIGMGRLGENTTLEKIQELDEAGLLERNFDHPPIKDTVTVPDGGYTIIRFIAKNPGYWLFHCHLTFHVEVGMGLVFHVGDQSMIPKVPKDFPRCGHWTPEPEPDFRENLLQFLKDQDEGKISVNFDLLPSNAKQPGPSYSTPTRRPHSNKQSSQGRNVASLTLIAIVAVLLTLV
ncbi:Multicopper oxidase [Halocaridina rubra]|uniref:Multicopper oxidase n=1 Tax=Halocaridina rubra TaxID=373956 RepID=A0AAN8WNV1_HALRR